MSPHPLDSSPLAAPPVSSWSGWLPSEAEADGRKSSCRLSVPAKGVR